MKHLYFDNGDIFPQIGLGTWLSKPNEVENAVYKAIEIGYRHIDAAYIYKNEKEVGNAIQQTIKDGLVNREELFITSKLWNNSHKKDEVERAIENSLNDFQLDYFDLYLIHWPLAFKKELAQSKDDLYSLEEVPLEDTWRGMIEVKNKKLTRHIGVSNYNIPKIDLLVQKTDVTPEVNQIELHPYLQQRELVRNCQKRNVLVTAYSPLGSRHLINTDKSITQHPVIANLVQKKQCTAAQIILAWGINRGTAVIPKSVTPSRIQENFEAIDIEFSKEEMQSIAEIDRNERNVTGNFAFFDNGAYSAQKLWEE